MLHFISNYSDWNIFLSAEMTQVFYCDNKIWSGFFFCISLQNAAFNKTIILKLWIYIHSFIIHAILVHLLMSFYILHTIAQFNVFSTNILFAICRYRKWKFSRNVTVPYIVLYFTGAKVIMVLEYTLINLGRNI